MRFLLQIGLTVVVVAWSGSAWGKPPDTCHPTWKMTLATALLRADQILVKAGEIAAPDAPVLWRIRGRKRVEEFLKTLEINDAESGLSDGGDGDPHFHFYAGDEPLAVISWQGGKTLRWRDGQWRGDALLSEKSQRALPAWFLEHGFPALQIAREREPAR